MRRKKDNASIMDGWGSFIHRLQSKKERKK